MNGEVLREAAKQLRAAVAEHEQVATDARVRGVWLNSRYQMTLTPTVALAMASLFDALAGELERGDYTVESDVLPTWLHCEIENVAHAYLGADL